jgi:hypothetical protein
MCNLQKYRYKLFGISVESDIVLPEGLVTNDLAEAYIETGSTPLAILDASLNTDFFQASANEFLLWVDGIARYYVKNGQSITVEPAGGTDDEIRLFLLSSAFGALIHQRGMLPIHASAVTSGGKAYVFAGVSGAGKSTLAAGLLTHGFEFLADDVCVVTLQESGRILLSPGYPQMKLWDDALSKLGKSSQSLRKIREHITKFALPVQQQFYNQQTTIQTIYILKPGQVQSISTKTLRGVDKFRTLNANIFRQFLVQGSTQRQQHFQQLYTLVSKIRLVQIERPADKFMLEELIQIVIDDISKNSD